jgi:hypothetical protein
MVLSDSRLKIKRANKHIEDIKARLRLLHDSQTSVVDVDTKTGCETLKYDFPDAETAFSDIALMLGDAVHNLNCALDYAWLETVKRLAPNSIGRRTKLPVRKTLDELEGSLKKAEIDQACLALFKFMMNQIQPYHGGNPAIWPIHVLDNRDKHRLLIPVLTSAFVERMEVEDKRAGGERFTGYASTGDFQKPPYFMTFERGLHIKNHSKLTARIIVYAETGYILSVPETLSDYSHYIDRVVEFFEIFLEAQPSG